MNSFDYSYKYSLKSKSNDPCILQSDCNVLSQFLGKKRPFVGANVQVSTKLISPARISRIQARLTDSVLIVEKQSSRLDYLKHVRDIYTGNLTIKQLQSLGFRI